MKVLHLLEASATRIYAMSRIALPNGYALPPLFYYILLTYKCNINCSFCFQRSRISSDPDGMLDPDQVLDYLRQIPFHAIVSFSGGEPLCHPEVFPILCMASQKHRISVVSNGSLLNDEMIESLLRLGPDYLGAPGLTVLGISLFESQKMEYFEAIFYQKKRMLKLLQNEKKRSGKALPIVDLKVVIRADTAGYLDRFLSFLREGLADVVTFQLHNRLMYYPYYDGRLDKRCSHRDALFGNLQVTAKEMIDSVTLKRQLQYLFSSRERKEKRIRFYPDIGLEETIRYYQGEKLQEKYYCVFPWSGLMISPFGNAFQCRNPRPEDLSAQSIRQAWNSVNFRKFRGIARTIDLAEKCSGCCFLKRVAS